jgi:hypothetical protein
MWFYEEYMKKFLLLAALLAGSAHAEITWKKVSTKPNTDGTMNEMFVLVDNMSCKGVNYAKMTNLYNEKAKKHFDYIQAFQIDIYQSKTDSLVILLPGPTTDFIDTETKEVLAPGIKDNGRKEIIYPKTPMGDIFLMACEKELKEGNKSEKKTDI